MEDENLILQEIPCVNFGRMCHFPSSPHPLTPPPHPPILLGWGLFLISFVHTQALILVKVLGQQQNNRDERGMQIVKVILLSECK